MSEGRERGMERRERQRGPEKGGAANRQTGGSPHTKGRKRRIAILSCMLIFLHDLVRGFGIDAIKSETKEGGIALDA